MRKESDVLREGGKKERTPGAKVFKGLYVLATVPTIIVNVRMQLCLTHTG